ncbi:MAG TPA: hypothetical protein VFK27_04230, partial [Bacillales bacterium]|nr:hypothetical protein [Bacillales bacterium]
PCCIPNCSRGIGRENYSVLRGKKSADGLLEKFTFSSYNRCILSMAKVPMYVPIIKDTCGTRFAVC